MPEGKDKTPGFDMSACITRMGKVSGITNPAAICQWMYQKGKTSGFPESFKKMSDQECCKFKEEYVKENSRVVFTSAMGQNILTMQEARIYIHSPSQAPKGAAVKRGKYGGLYYEEKPVAVAKGPAKEFPSAKGKPDEIYKEPLTDEEKKALRDRQIALAKKYREPQQPITPSSGNRQLDDFLKRTEFEDHHELIDWYNKNKASGIPDEALATHVGTTPRTLHAYLQIAKQIEQPQIPEGEEKEEEPEGMVPLTDEEKYMKWVFTTAVQSTPEYQGEIERMQDFYGKGNPIPLSDKQRAIDKAVTLIGKVYPRSVGKWFDLRNLPDSLRKWAEDKYYKKSVGQSQ